jgi:O-antigen ligase
MTTESLAQRLMGMSGRARAVLIGVTLGVLAGVLGLGLVLAGPVIMIGGVLGLLAGLYILTDIQAALYAVIAVIGLLPFGTLPFNIGLTPTFLDTVMGAFLLVYLFQWMTGRRRLFRGTPVNPLVLFFVVLLVFSFVLGLAHAQPTPATLRQFAELLLSITTALILVDVIRDEPTLRRVTAVVLVIGGITALTGVILYVLPDATAERLLVMLARIGYPNGGVIRYVEDNPALAERAIGLWVDPNAFGGVLAVLGAMAAPQVFAQQPVGGRRWVVAGALGAITLCLLLTFSRGSLLALATGVLFIAAMRYRRLLLILIVLVALLLLLPVTQSYVTRFVEGFQGADQATQMRFGEYRDALRLIGRYPVLGVGFSGTPEIDLYLGVANLYLTMASNIGLVGTAVFLLTVGSLFLYGLRAWRRPSRPERFEPLWLGTHAGLVAALATGVFDHYFFKLEFQASVAFFWLIVGLALSTSRLWPEAPLPDAHTLAGKGGHNLT